LGGLRGEGVGGLSFFGSLWDEVLGRLLNAFANIGCAVQERRWRSI
jgi:hypothetical protein